MRPIEDAPFFELLPWYNGSQIYFPKDTLICKTWWIAWIIEIVCFRGCWFNVVVWADDSVEECLQCQIEYKAGLTYRSWSGKTKGNGKQQVQVGTNRKFLQWPFSQSFHESCKQTCYHYTNVLQKETYMYVYRMIANGNHMDIHAAATTQTYLQLNSWAADCCCDCLLSTEPYAHACW